MVHLYTKDENRRLYGIAGESIIRDIPIVFNQLGRREHDVGSDSGWVPLPVPEPGHSASNSSIGP